MAGEHDVTVTAPRLWSPGAAAGWSLLFGPLFGVILHWKNWHALGQAAQAAQSRAWFWMIVASMLLLGGLGVADVLPELGRGVDIGLLAGWYVRNGRSQCRHVASAYGKNYPHRSLGLPLVLASACTVAVMGLVILVAYLAPQGAELA